MGVATKIAVLVPQGDWGDFSPNPKSRQKLSLFNIEKGLVFSPLPSFLTYLEKAQGFENLGSWLTQSLSFTIIFAGLAADLCLSGADFQRFFKLGGSALSPLPPHFRMLMFKVSA